MRGASAKGKPSAYVVGRGALIVFVVILGALGFTFGYFVGRGKHEKQVQLNQPTPEEPAPHSPQPTAQSSQTPADQGQSPLQPRETADPRAVQSGHPPPIQQTPVSGVEPAPPGTGRNRTFKPAAVQGEGPSRETAVGLKGEAERPATRERLYTVQLAAFRNMGDAEAFSARYQKKGLKTYMTVSENARREKVYKIKSGEFTDRKDAEILSLKLKKTEGLQAFVTFKDS